MGGSVKFPRGTLGYAGRGRLTPRRFSADLLSPPNTYFGSADDRAVAPKCISLSVHYETNHLPLSLSHTPITTETDGVFQKDYLWRSATSGTNDTGASGKTPAVDSYCVLFRH